MFSSPAVWPPAIGSLSHSIDGAPRLPVVDLTLSQPYAGGLTRLRPAPTARPDTRASMSPSRLASVPREAVVDDGATRHTQCRWIESC